MQRNGDGMVKLMTNILSSVSMSYSISLTQSAPRRYVLRSKLLMSYGSVYLCLYLDR